MKIHKLRHIPALSFINRAFSAARYHRMALFPENPICIPFSLVSNLDCQSYIELISDDSRNKHKRVQYQEGYHR